MGTGDSAARARSAEAVTSVATGNGAAGARSAEAPASVSTGDSAGAARSAEAPVSVNMGDFAAGARSAEAPVSVSMADSAAAARSAKAPRGNTQSRRRTALVRSESGRRTGWPVGVCSWNFPTFPISLSKRRQAVRVPRPACACGKIAK